MTLNALRASAYRCTLIFIATYALAASANAQNSAESTTACPEAWEMDAQQLQGEWQATLAGQADAVRLLLGPHPEWKGMVKGEVLRPGTDTRTAMVGDVDNGNVTLEESANGTNISATWWGEVTDGSCAREIRGQYQQGDETPTQPFVLHKHTP